MTDHTTDSTRERSALASPWLGAVLSLAAAVLAVLVVLHLQAGPDAGSPGATPTRVTDRDQRADLLDVAARAGERVLSYGHDSFDRDVDAARRGMTGEFAEEYAAAMERVRDDTLREEIDQVATAVTSGVVSATGTRAEVLVFVNRQTTSGTTGARQVERDRLTVTLVRRGGGAWTVAGVTSLG